MADESNTQRGPRRGFLGNVWQWYATGKEQKRQRKALQYDLTNSERWRAKSFQEILRKEWWEIRMARALREGRPTDELRNEETRECCDGLNAVPNPLTKQNLVGLAFSGGGIRSATLNLGILQGLAKFKLLERFDYVSAVSGGNYIASWLAAWIKREGFPEVMKQLTPDRAGPATPDSPPPPEAPAQPREEASAIRWLRDYSNYLTPRRGLLSGDTWAAIATYTRNLLLNQTILVLAFASILLFPRVLTWAGREIGEIWRDHLYTLSWPTEAHWWTPEWLKALLGDYPGPGHIFFLTAFVLLAMGVRAIHNNMRWFTEPKSHAYPAGQVFGKILVPFLVASWMLTVWMWYGPASNDQPWLAPLEGAEWHWVALIAVLYTVPWLAASLAGTYDPLILGVLIKGDPIRKYIIPVTAPFAGALGGILLWSIGSLFESWKPSGSPITSGGLWSAMSWGTPLVLVSLTLMAVLHIGLMGLAFQESKREWWSRLGGLILTSGLCWATLFGVSVYGPLVLMWMGGKIAAGGLAGWIATTVGGVLGGTSAKSGKKDPSPTLEIFLKVAPVIFIAGLLLLVSLGVHVAVVKMAAPDIELSIIWRHFQKPPTADAQAGALVCFACSLPGKQEAVGPPEKKIVIAMPETQVVISPHPIERSDRAARTHWSLMNLSNGGWNLVGMIVAMTCAFALAWRVDINEFSMHLFYRNRLTRCYVAASRKPREPNPFTGFYPKDDMYLAACSNAAKVRAGLAGQVEGKEEYAGPYPLVNTALNLTTSQKLAWQSRKARSFTFSPRYCGFEVLPDEKKPEKLEDAGYRETLAYAFGHLYGLGGPLSGTAMGISGAAASPNMGYHSSPPLAFLMTVFNVRLGLWLGNPRHRDAWTRSGPRWGLPYLFHELAGTATDERWYVYLSDGGHFENLGVYELVRRRCKFIVACDASADPKVSFDDLGNAIEKCRVDFGVDIEIQVEDLKPPEKSKISRRHCAVGNIRYRQAYGEQEEDGILLYLKASLTGDEPPDVRHYSEQNAAFPHTSTGNQFFDEAQFESYRELGYHIVAKTFGAMGKPEAVAAMPTEKVFEGLQWHWPGPTSMGEP